MRDLPNNCVQGMRAGRSDHPQFLSMPHSWTVGSSHPVMRLRMRPPWVKIDGKQMVGYIAFHLGDESKFKAKKTK